MAGVSLNEFVKEGILRVVCKPGASKTEVVSVESGGVKISISERPEKGKANKGRFVSKSLKKKVTLVSGGTARIKKLKIE